MNVLVATHDRVFLLTGEGELRPASGPDGSPTLPGVRSVGRPRLVRDEGRRVAERRRGESWTRAGLGDEEVTALAADPLEAGAAWAGTEPSAVFRSDDGGRSWERSRGLLELPSSSEWSFPPKPETHHVRWIAPSPVDAGRLWVAIETGAPVTTADGGATWRNRVYNAFRPGLRPGSRGPRAAPAPLLGCPGGRSHHGAT